MVLAGIGRGAEGLIDDGLHVGRGESAAIDVGRHGNPFAASDVGVALELLGTGLRGAALNVHANLGSIDEAGWVDGVRREIERLEAAAPLLAGDVRTALTGT